MNFKQYSEEILESHLVPYGLSRDDSTGFYLIEDGHPAHGSAVAGIYRESYGIKNNSWPAGSPDFNAILML